MKRALPVLLTLPLAAACGGGKSSNSPANVNSNGPHGEEPGPGGIDIGGQINTSTNTGMDPGNLSITPPQTLVVAGALNIPSGASLTDAAGYDEIVAFPAEFKDGGGSPQQWKHFPVAADGTFKAELDRANEADALLGVIKADGSLDVERLKGYLHQDSVEGIDLDKPLSAEDAAKLKKLIEDEAARLARKGARSYVLVAVKKSENVNPLLRRIEEGKSFRYIGLPVGGANLLNLPASEAKVPQLDIGQVDVQGDEGRAARAASSQDFSVADATLAEVAAVNAVLKGIKNQYVNSDPQGQESWRSSPYFSFRTLTTRLYGEEGSLPTDTRYSGYGLYFGVEKEGLTLDNICGASPRRIELFPPAGQALLDGKTGDVIATPLTNVGTGNPTATQGTRRECSHDYTLGLGSGSFYGHGDTGDHGGLGWNWGGGDGFRGEFAKGDWTLKLDGQLVASFDFGASYPVKEQPRASGLGKELVPTVYVPRARAIKAQDGTVERFEIRFVRLDPKTGDYLPAEPIAFARQVTQVSVEMDDYGGNPRASWRRCSASEEMAPFEVEAAGVRQHLFKFDVMGPTDNRCADGPEAMAWVATDGTRVAGKHLADSIAVSYEMYGSSYRFDFREYFNDADAQIVGEVRRRDATVPMTNVNFVMSRGGTDYNVGVDDQRSAVNGNGMRICESSGLTTLAWSRVTYFDNGFQTINAPTCMAHKSDGQGNVYLGVKPSCTGTGAARNALVLRLTCPNGLVVTGVPDDQTIDISAWTAP